jgi:hypothetical protein
MPYGIGLIFDPPTEARIREVWGHLARQGQATPLGKRNKKGVRLSKGGSYGSDITRREA